jgi:histidinol dehydrogenase
MPQPQSQAAFSHPSPQVGEKRKSTVAAMSSPADLEDEGRMAAEEDKRRRNTAASARFRVKKKQREQALEKSAKDMSDKVQQLEARVNQLEMENKWLKGLITEKNLKGPTADSETTEAKKAETIIESRKKGVGTENMADQDVKA